MASEGHVHTNHFCETCTHWSPVNDIIGECHHEEINHVTLYKESCSRWEKKTGKK